MRDLTPAAFERLLRALDPDRERAAIAYESLRGRLIGLLAWWGAVHPQELADETLDRVAQKLEEGSDVPQKSLGAFVRGVARMVFYESRRDASTLPIDDRDVAAPIGDEDVERALGCLDRCLDTFSGEDRSLLLRYYGSGKKSEVRASLASTLGITPTALRIRTHRLRARLEACVNGCLGR